MLPRSLLARVAPLFFIAMTALLVWPLYPWLGNSIEPRVFGLPWSLVYLIGIIVIDAAALTALYLLRIVDAEEDGDRG
nr:hypothetical protein [Nannocystis sp.]